MSHIAELTDAEYPSIYSTDGETASAGVVEGEKSFFLFSIQVGDQSPAKHVVAHLIATAETVTPEPISVYIWATSEWIRLGYIDSDGTLSELVGELDYRASYVNDDGICYLMLTTQHWNTAISLDYIKLEFNDLTGIVGKRSLKVIKSGNQNLLANVTNEWVMGTQLKAYHPSESSMWKPDAYSDYWPFVNRCHFMSPEIAGDPALLWHTAFGNKMGPNGVPSPESPSALNYAPLAANSMHLANVNQIDCDPGSPPEDYAACVEARKNFYRSCRIYEPDPEIESAESITEEGVELVKLTFKTRLHHAADAPAAIERDRGTWNKTALRTEAATIRTVENALREYLVNQDDGTNATATGPGNSSALSLVQGLPDNPYGSVYPTFYFVQLIPSPFEDGNDRQDPCDTPVYHDPFMQMELYLRAMCEGYIDGVTSAETACGHDWFEGTKSHSAFYDYTFENLCYDAFGNRWFSLLPDTLRTDNPQGFGPLPNTELLHQTFNQFSQAINLLTRVRVMLPMVLEVWYGEGSTTKFVTAYNADGTVNTDTVAGNCALYFDGKADDAAVTWGTPDWHVFAGVPIQTNVQSFIDGVCDGTGKWALKTIRTSVKIRYKTTDPDAMEALPEAWRDMFSDQSYVMAKVTSTGSVLSRELTTLEDSAHCCIEAEEPCPGAWSNGAGQYWKFPSAPVVVETCVMMPGIWEEDPLEGSTHARRQTATATCTPGPTNYSTFLPVVTYGGAIDVPLV